MAIMKPKININGATRESHVKARVKVLKALRAAMAEMAEIRPHGRDYLGDNAAYKVDFAIYCERFSLLDRVYNELEDEALSIQKGD